MNLPSVSLFPETFIVPFAADWMQRNFDQPGETAFPVLDAQHQVKLKEILETQLY